MFYFNVWKTTQPISEEETKHDKEMTALAAENPRVRCQMYVYRQQQKADL